MIVYSPNVQCEPAGPGRGRSGQPGMIGENCVPQGNVLIIQEDTVEYPEASFDGGMIRFDFQKEAKAVYSLELMNINGNATYVTVTHSGETVVRISVVGLGRNSIQTVSINLENVSSITVTFTEPGAVTQLNGCFEPSTRPPSVIAPTLPGTTPTGVPPTQPVPTPSIGTPTQPAPTPDSTTPTQQTPTPGHHPGTTDTNSGTTHSKWNAISISSYQRATDADSGSTRSKRNNTISKCSKSHTTTRPRLCHSDD